jgi:alpha-L-arabinofuranosidase
MGLPGQEVGICQAVYLPVERELSYRGVLFALASEGAVDLEVSFRCHAQSGEVLVYEALHVNEQHKWVRLPFELNLRPDAIQPLEEADFAVAVKNGRRVSLDEIRPYPNDAIDGLDPDVLRAAAELSTPLVRYGGNFSSGYHWRDGVGPLDRRPTRLNEAWGMPEYNEFGTDEFMNLCRRIGALPQICLNLGSGTVSEARGWVEYCQGSPETLHGRLRASNGRRSPYAVAAWELGNELYDHNQLCWYGAEAYARRYLEFFEGIRAVVPATTSILANGAEIDSFRKWNGALLAQAGSELQYLVTHLVADLQDVQDRTARKEDVLAADLALPVGVGRRLAGLRKQIDSFPSMRDRVKIYSRA